MGALSIQQFLVEPYMQALGKAEQEHSRLVEDARLLNTHGSRIARQLTEVPAEIAGVENVVAAIIESASRHDIDMTRFEDMGRQGVRVWIDDAPYPAVVDWIQALESQSVALSQGTFSQIGPGRVSLRAVFH